MVNIVSTVTRVDTFQKGGRDFQGHRRRLGSVVSQRKTINTTIFSSCIFVECSTKCIRCSAQKVQTFHTVTVLIRGLRTCM